jgi:hypothetical protein
MKKVSLLILLAILASTLLTAAIPTKMVRLTIINKSGYDVYMKLEGSAITEAYYYLTVPSGDRDVPTIKIFTVMSDVYNRTTWQCDGAKSSGVLIVDGNIRLTFTPCGQMACGFGPSYNDQTWINRCTGETMTLGSWVRKRHAGEPRMEKVTYFRVLFTYANYPAQYWYLLNGWLPTGCGTWSYRIRSYYLPYGCQFRYQY